jgi:hypothetical protein
VVLLPRVHEARGVDDVLVRIVRGRDRVVPHAPAAEIAAALAKVAAVRTVVLALQ